MVEETVKTWFSKWNSFTSMLMLFLVLINHTFSRFIFHFLPLPHMFEQLQNEITNKEYLFNKY